MLNARRKWTEESKHLTVDEVVLFLEPGLPRGNWYLGRIEQIHSAPDGHVRPADVYEFLRLIFGDKASPYLDVCQEHAKSHSEDHPEAAKTVLELMYMDDVMQSISNAEKAVGLWHDLTELLRLAGMKI